MQRGHAPSMSYCAPAQLMPVAPRCVGDAPVPAVSRPEAFCATALLRGPAAQVAPPPAAEQPEDPGRDMLIRMALPAPLLGMPPCLYLWLAGLSIALEAPPRHALFALVGCHQC